jgi:putative transposase
MVHLFYQSSDERFTPIHLPQVEWVSNQQANALQQVTTKLAKTKAVLVIEDLQVAGLLTNHYLAQALADGGFAEFRRHLLDKAACYGSQVLLAARWEPSSKTCSGCGWYDADLELADRVFRCQHADCGQLVDRDLNAALNPSKLAGSSSESENACGAASAGWGREALVKLTAVKQEPNTLCASA